MEGKRIRSPNYPALSLPDAIEKVTALHRAQHIARRELLIIQAQAPHRRLHNALLVRFVIYDKVFAKSLAGNLHCFYVTPQPICFYWCDQTERSRKIRTMMVEGMPVREYFRQRYGANPA